MIVVDDGSTRRETLEVLDSLGVEVIHQVNAGVAAARNTGIAAGTGRYVLPLDSDDWLRPGFLEPLVRHMDNHDSAIATTACQSYGHKQDRLIPPALVTASQMATKCDILNTSLFRRSDWEGLSGYDETLRKGFEDWEWWTRLLLHTVSTARRADGPEYMYRVSKYGRNHTNYAGIDTLLATRKAMIKNEPGFRGSLARWPAERRPPCRRTGTEPVSHRRRSNPAGPILGQTVRQTGGAEVTLSISAQTHITRRTTFAPASLKDRRQH